VSDNHEHRDWDGDERRAIRNAAPQHAGGVKFDATINLGHVLTFIGFVIAGFTAWSTLDKRLTVIEERATFQAQIDRQQDAKLVESMTSIKEALTDIRSNINRLSDGRRGAP
jgi:uncharacterized coiled-coil protein SlyX